MSNALALAAVTATLTELLDDDLAKDLSSVDGRVQVTAKAPDLIQTEGTDQRQLNLFLYQVTPNPGWSNLGLPARDARGERTANPPLALDLHYLLTAYASGSLQAESILGHAMLCLHEWSVVPRKKLAKFQEGWKEHHDALVRALSASGLTNQVEQIKICPEPFGVEELSKLWTAFQTSYRPTVAYRVSVVLIESALPARSALPVLKRGGEKDRGWDSFSGGIPQIEQILPSEMAKLPLQKQIVQQGVTPGAEITLKGRNLLADRFTVMFGHSQVPFGTWPLFGVGPDFVNDMNKGEVSERLRKWFKDRGFHLPTPPSITVELQGSRWAIGDGYCTIRILNEQQKQAELINSFSVTPEGDLQLRLPSDLPAGIIPVSLQVPISKGPSAEGTPQDQSAEGTPPDSWNIISNTVALMLRPQLSDPKQGPTTVVNGLTVKSVTCTIRPPVQPGQRGLLLLNEMKNDKEEDSPPLKEKANDSRKDRPQRRGYSIAFTVPVPQPPKDAALLPEKPEEPEICQVTPLPPENPGESRRCQVTVRLPQDPNHPDKCQVQAGTYLVRVQIDGAESLPVKSADPPHEFDATQKVTIS